MSNPQTLYGTTTESTAGIFKQFVESTAIFTIEIPAAPIGDGTAALWLASVIGLFWVFALALDTDPDNPISQLAGTVERINEGKSVEELPTDRADEIGRLAGAIEELVQEKNPAVESTHANNQAIEFTHSDNKAVDSTQANEPPKSQYAPLLGTFPSAVLRVEYTDSDIIMQQANPQFEELFDTGSDEIRDTSVFEEFPQLTQDQSSLIKQLQSGSFVTRKLTQRTQRRTNEYQLQFLPPEEAGSPRSGYVIISKKQSEQQELERYRAYTDEILNAIDDVFYLVNADGDILRWNDPLIEVTGYSHDEIATMDPLDLFPPNERDRIESAAETVFETGEGLVESAIQTKEGERVPFEFVAVSLKDPDGNAVLAGIGREITERKEQERQLRERERELRTLMDNIPGMVYRAQIEPSWPFEFVSEGSLEVTGYTPEELKSAEINWGEDVIVSDNDALFENVQRALDQREAFNVTYQIENADGELRWLWEQGRGVYNEEDTLVALEGVILDVTDQQRTKDELERTRELLQKAQQLANVGAWEADLTTNPPQKYYSDEVCRIFNIPSGESFTTEEYLELVHPDDREVVEEQIITALKTGEPYDYETRLVNDDGEVSWIHIFGDPIQKNGEVIKLRGAIQEITEQKERERELEQTKHLLEQTQRLARVGGWELDVTTDPPYSGTFTDQLYRIHEHPVDSDEEFTKYITDVHVDDRDKLRDAVRESLRTGESYEVEARYITEKDNEIWARTTGEPVFEDGELVKLRGGLQDITEQKERQLALESLHETTRGLLGTETEAEVAELVVESAKETLDVSGIAVYLLDEETNHLVPTAYNYAFDDLFGEPESIPIDHGDSVLWESFINGSTNRIESVSTEAPRLLERQVEGGIVVPIRDYGVFVIGSPDDKIDDDTQRLVETLVATTEAALDRLNSEELLRERESELANRNRRLRHQVQTNNIIRSIHQSLIGAESRSDIERAVCNRLIEAENIKFAWIGEQSPNGTELKLRAWDGSGQDYLDELSLSIPEGTEPALQTARTGEPNVVENVLQEINDSNWQQSALTRNFHSILSVPLSFEEFSFGVLTVYADEPDSFLDLERTVFTELGESIANSIIAVNTRQALHSDTVVELTLELAGDSFFTSVAQTANCQVEYEGLASHSGEHTNLYLSTSGANAETVQEAFDNLVSVTEARLISSNDESCLFEVSIAGETVPSRLVRHGGNPRSIQTNGSTLEIVVDVPTTTNVSEFVGMLEDEYSEITLMSRRSLERSIQTKQEYLDSLIADLTERQLEVLRTAYYAGFFEWPRISTGEDIATMLDITQPTVNRHLRLGQQRLFERLFENSPGLTLSEE